jgi:hypothetical protein
VDKLKLEMGGKKMKNRMYSAEGIKKEMGG